MGLEMKYFVLNPNKEDDYGFASREAMRTYSKTIRENNDQLANDLIKWVHNIEDKIIARNRAKENREKTVILNMQLVDSRLEITRLERKIKKLEKKK